MTVVVATLHSLIATEFDARRRLDFWGDIIEAYTRAISLYAVALDSKTSGASLAGKMDRLIVEIHESIDPDKPRAGSVERLAKLLFRSESADMTRTPLESFLLFIPLTS